MLKWLPTVAAVVGVCLFAGYVWYLLYMVLGPR